MTPLYQVICWFWSVSAGPEKCQAISIRRKDHQNENESQAQDERVIVSLLELEAEDIPAELLVEVQGEQKHVEGLPAGPDLREN